MNLRFDGAAEATRTKAERERMILNDMMVMNYRVKNAPYISIKNIRVCLLSSDLMYD